MKKHIAAVSLIAGIATGFTSIPTHAASPRQAIVTNLRLLRLGADAFPGLRSGTLGVDVYKAAADIDVNNPIEAHTAGEMYRSLGTYGSMKEEALTAAGNWKDQLVSLFATSFPSSTAARQAFSADVSSLNQMCNTTVESGVEDQTASCAYSDGSDTLSDKSLPSATLSYRISRVGTVEYIVTSFIEDKGKITRAAMAAAEPLAARTVALIAQREAGHLQHLLSLNNAPPTAVTPLAPAPQHKPAPVVRRAPATTAAFTIRTWVSPDTMPYNAYPTLYVKSAPGATCAASVMYSTGRSPVSFSGYAQTLPASGTVQWSWHEETKGDGGIATVDCSYRGQQREAVAQFAVQ